MAGGGRKVEMAETRVSPDLENLSREARQYFVDAVSRAVAERGGATVALAGGTTPRRLYELLAVPETRDRVPWRDLHIFWTDERAVEPDDPRSNYRLARDTLLAHVPVPPGQVHRMPAEESDLEAAARNYEQRLAGAAACGVGVWPRLDLVLLGMGSDGHTASLFPGDPALGETKRMVAAVEMQYWGTRRLTLTLPVLNAAARVLFVVAGSDKANAVRRVLAGDPLLPAARVKPANGELIWLLDAAAARSPAPLT